MFDCCAFYWSWKIVSKITAWGVQSDCLWSDNLCQVFEPWGVPSIRLPMLWFRSLSFMINSVRTQQSNTHFIINHQEQVIKGEGGVAVSGCHGSVAKRWRLKPETLGSNPGSTTFLSFPLSFQKSLDGLWSDNLYQVFGPWGSPIHQTPHAVIMLTILSWSA